MNYENLENPPCHCLSVQTLGINSFTHMDVDANVRTDTHTHTRTQLFTENENTKSFSCCRVLGSELQPFTSAVTRHQ